MSELAFIDFPITNLVCSANSIYGNFNFSNLHIDNDGLDSYETSVHLIIYSNDLEINFGKEALEIGRYSQKLSNSAMRDPELDFIYHLKDLNDISWHQSIDPISVRNHFITSNIKDNYNFTVEVSIEFKRSTTQDATFDMFYELSKYKTPDIPNDNFHYKQNMNTTLLPESFEIAGSSIIGASKRVHLFLPDELVPRYFKSNQDHTLNQSKIPLTINLELELSNSDNKYGRGFSVQYEGINGLRNGNDDKIEKFKLFIELKDTPLIPITIKTISFIGQIKLKATLELKSLWEDTGIYAQNEYFASPNAYLLIMVFTGTVFAYKMVEYVEYRLFQNSLAQKNYGLVEAEFMN